MAKETDFRIGKQLVLSNVSASKKSDNVLTLVAGKVSKLSLDSTVKKNSNALITSGAVFSYLERLGLSAGGSSLSGGGSASIPGWNSVMSVGNYTTREVKIRDTTGTHEFSVSVDSNGNLIFAGPANKNAHFSGDVIAYSTAVPPVASWWDDIPVDGVTIQLNGSGQLEVIGGVGGGAWGSITGTLSDQTDLQNELDGKSPTTHNHSGVYEPVFTKNTAFNKNFGTGLGEVAQGNHLHTGVYEQVFTKNTAFNKNFGTGLGEVAQGNHLHTGVYANASHTHLEVDITDLDKYWIKTGSDIAYSAGKVQIKAGKQLEVFKTDNTQSWSISVDSNNHLILTGPTNANLHVSGDVVAYSAATPPAASWWDDIPVDGVTIQLNGSGQLEAIGGGGGGAWGSITGTLSDQTDLNNALNSKQATLVSGTNIKTINSASLVGSGDVTVQATLVSGTNIKTVNGSSVLGSGDLVVSGSDPRVSTKYVVIESDFYNASVNAIPGILGVAISSGTVAGVAAQAGHPGIIYIRDSTTANGGYRFMTDATSFRLSAGMKTEFVFQIRGVRAGMKCRLGWHDSTATQTAPVDGAFIDCIGNGSTLTFTGKCRNNNSETTTTSSYTASTNTWYRLVIEIITTSLVRFTVYDDSGTSLWTQDVTTNIPTASGRDTGWGIIAGETSTDAAADIIWLDYAKMESTGVITRGNQVS